MREQSILGGMPSSLQAVDDILRQQQNILSDMQRTTTPSRVYRSTGTAPTPTPVFEKTSPITENPAVSSRATMTTRSKPFVPLSGEDLTRVFNRAVQQPAIEVDGFRQPYAPEMDNFRQPTAFELYPFPQPSTAQPEGSPNPQSISQDSYRSPEMAAVPLQSFAPSTQVSPNQQGTASTPSRITEQQLRAMSRRHLLMMIRDLEEELRQQKEEKEAMLLAYRAGIAQRVQMG